MNTYKIRKIAKLAAIGAAFTLFGTGIGYAAGEWENIWVQFDSVNLKVNGQNVTSSNLLYNDRTYVPLRACAEMLGSTVGWDQNTNTASILVNTAGSADMAKIEKIQAASRIANNLVSIYKNGKDLYIDYIECINYSNSIINDVVNRNDLVNISLEIFNRNIETYNNNISLLDEIKTDSVIINMQLDKSSSMIEYLGNSIDNLKTAYDKLKSFDESSNRQLYEEAMAFYDKAFENIRQALLIQDEYYKLINTYIQKI